MPQGMAQALREITLGRKELKTSAFTVTATATAFTSALTLGCFRKLLLVYAGSGEVFAGDEDVSTSNGMPIPNGIWQPIPVSTELPICFVCASGSTIPIRIMEIS